MAFLEIKNIRLAGMSVGVPRNIKNNLDDPNISDEYTPEDFVKSTGVKERRIGNLAISELLLPAAEQLIEDLKWDKQDIEALFVVTQMGDYIVPSTACVLHGKLGLNMDCYAMDISLGCTGWVYGLSSIAALMSSTGLKKALLCTGDARRRAIYNDPLFGHAGTVTALEYQEDATSLKFHMGTDGTRYDAIIIPDGGSKHPFTEKSLIPHEFEGKMLLPLQSHMKGMDVFSFGFSIAPKSIKKLSSYFSIDYQNADYVVFHQANMQMNNLIIKKLKLDKNKVPTCMYNYGNTSSASIPLTIVTQLEGKLTKEENNLICCGFGVGLSWATVALSLDEKFIISKLVEVDDTEE